MQLIDRLFPYIILFMTGLAMVIMLLIYAMGNGKQKTYQAVCGPENWTHFEDGRSVCLPVILEKVE